MDTPKEKPKDSPPSLAELAAFLREANELQADVAGNQRYVQEGQRAEEEFLATVGQAQVAEGEFAREGEQAAKDFDEELGEEE